MTRTASVSDSVLLSKYLSPCPSSHCTVCKGSGSNLVNPEWMLDSGASAHFTPVFSDFITLVRVNTAASPLKQLGFGMVLLHTSVKTKKGLKMNKTLRIRDVCFVPHITQRI